MTLSINSNLASLAVQSSQSRAQGDLATAVARLSSGLRINGARDDAAGLAISERFTAQIRGLTQAGRNANDAISVAQTAEGALASISDNLQRMRELAVQSVNATNSSSDRSSLQLEISQLQSEIDRVARQTSFNGINLLDGSFSGQQFQVGANSGETIGVPSLTSFRSKSLGVFRGFSTTNTTLGGAQNNTPGTFTVQYLGGPTFTIATIAADAKAMVAALNNGTIPGMSATVNATHVAAVSSAATAPAGAAGTATLTVNGLAIAITGSSGVGSLAGNRSRAVAAINAQSALTGVVASDTGAGVALDAADGRNIALAYAAGSFGGSAAADFGLSSAALSAGTFNMVYEAPASVTAAGLFLDITTGYTNPVGIGAAAGTAISAIDISSTAGANVALGSIDRALGTVSSARASLGAVQNRFASAVHTVQSTGENLSASRGRVRDADFAVEAARLSRASVLQQAGTAMLAQANQTSAQVQALLR